MHPDSEGEEIRRAGPTILGWDLARPGGDYSAVTACSYDANGKLAVHAGYVWQTPDTEPATKEYDLEIQPDGTYAPRPRVRAEG